MHLERQTISISSRRSQRSASSGTPASLGLFGDLGISWERLHIQSQSPGSLWLLTAPLSGFYVLKAHFFPLFIHLRGQNDYYIHVTAILSFCSFSSLAPGKPILYSEFPPLKPLVQFPFSEPPNLHRIDTIIIHSFQMIKSKAWRKKETFAMSHH